MPNVNITSSALNGAPSPQRTSFRSVNVYVRPSLDSVQLRASARRRGGGPIVYSVERNAFLDVRGDGFTQNILRKFGIDCVVRGPKAYVLGDRAFELATIFDKPVRRPLKQRGQEILGSQDQDYEAGA